MNEKMKKKTQDEDHAIKNIYISGGSADTN